MTNQQIKEHLIVSGKVLDDYLSDEQSIRAIVEAGRLMIDALRNDNMIISCGNGGSMCDAIHFAEELSGKFRDDRKALRAISISDPGFISCVANDYNYSHVFSRFVDGVGKKGDVLLAISTSGNSENVVMAAQQAKKKHMQVVSLTGKDGGKLSTFSDVELRVPYVGYTDKIQEVHIKIIHTLILFIESGIGK